MFFDIRSLVEWLTSSVWTWTAEACERALASFGLEEVSSALGRREFAAPSGLRAYLYSRLDGSPERIEFPLALPDTLRGDPATLNRYVDFIARPFKQWLGEPAALRLGDIQSRSWSLATGMFTVEPDTASAGGVQGIAMILRRADRNG